MLRKLKSLTRQLHLGVRGKLLVPTVTTLIIVIIGLALVTVQQRLNRAMRQGIEQTPETANAEISADLNTLKNDIETSLRDMSEASSSELSRSTTTALEKQNSRIEHDWETMMMESGDSLALLMARVAPNAIIGKYLKALNSYVNAALQNPNVIYAFYFRPDGQLLTRFIDQKNEKIQTYLKGEGKNRYRKILAGAKNDNTVMIVNKTITFEGDVLGSAVKTDPDCGQGHRRRGRRPDHPAECGQQGRGWRTVQRVQHLSR